jgi:hypothetical protein
VTEFQRTHPGSAGYSQRRFSVASRPISAALTGGRPARFGSAHLRVTRRRCYRRTVPGVTSRCARSFPGRSRIKTARTARPAQSSGGRGWVRRSTATSCRSTSSSRPWTPPNSRAAQASRRPG